MYPWGAPALPLGEKKIIVSTSRGDIEIRLFGDDAPNAVESILHLAEKGFYNGLTFHRIVPGFVIQGGCPRGDGWGDGGYLLRNETTMYRYERGTVGMADSGKDTAGSQFFITHTPQPHLNGRYTIVGKVTRGMEVVDAIEEGDAFTVAIIE
jgi:peptidyl-prolyl cis-trans isomerase B (cyclophilin B)